MSASKTSKAESMPLRANDIRKVMLGEKNPLGNGMPGTAITREYEIFGIWQRQYAPTEGNTDKIFSATFSIPADGSVTIIGLGEAQMTTATESRLEERSRQALDVTNIVIPSLEPETIYASEHKLLQAMAESIAATAFQNGK